MIENHMDAYKLRATVKHVQGSYSALIADTIGRYKRGEPILHPVGNVKAKAVHEHGDRSC